MEQNLSSEADSDSAE